MCLVIIGRGIDLNKMLIDYILMCGASAVVNTARYARKITSAAVNIFLDVSND